MKDTYISYLHKKMQIFTTFSIILMITLSINSIESFHNHNVSPHILLQIPKYNMKKTETKWETSDYVTKLQSEEREGNFYAAHR